MNYIYIYSFNVSVFSKTASFMKLPRFPRMNGPADLLQSEPLLRPTVLMQSTCRCVPNGFRTVDGWGTPDLWVSLFIDLFLIQGSESWLFCDVSL